MTPDIDSIDHRYSTAIVIWCMREGRDKHDMLPEERVRFNCWRKAGCSIWAAYNLLDEESHER